MAYSIVSGTDASDLFDEIATFAAANGWTVDWNTGSQLGLHSGTCYAAFGVDGTTNPVAVTDTYPEPDEVLSDFRVYGALSSSFTPATFQYWGHPDSIVTTATDSDRVYLNDLLGPFSEIHLFGDASKIVVVVRSDEDRYTHFAFGVLDKKGMTTPDVAFMAGVYHEWWNNATTSPGGVAVNIKAAMVYGNNRMWFSGDAGNMQFYIPDGVLDPAYSFTDGKVVTHTRLARLTAWASFGIAGLDQGAAPGLIDHWGWSKNKPVTGGVPLLSIPILLREGSVASGFTTFCGEIPDIRVCDVSNLSIGETISYGSEDYLVFPIKRRTNTSYDGKASTYRYGIAIKKEV